MYAWRNHPATRGISRDPRAIAWPDHLAWLERVLADSQRLLLVGCLGGKPVGFIRFDRGDAGDVEVSLYLDPALQGTGLGPALLRAGEAAAQRWIGGAVVFVARVLCNNARSGRMFSNAGYEYAEGCWRRSAPGPQTA
jgi:RimJ/RimL family protein N-acetyltransferase